MPYKNHDKYLKYHRKYYELHRNPRSADKNPTFTLCRTCSEPIRTCLSRIFKGKARYCPKHRYSRLIGNKPWNYGMRIAEHPKNRNHKRHRTCGLYEDWHNDILKRDWYKCQICSSKEKIEVHHIKSYKDHPKERIDMDNGITLCKSCHMWIHNLNPLNFQ